MASSKNVKVNPFLDVTFETVLDGCAIKGLSKGIVVVDRSNVATIVEMSVEGELFPYEVVAAAMDKKDSSTWYVWLKEIVDNKTGSEQSGEE